MGQQPLHSGGAQGRTTGKAPVADLPHLATHDLEHLNVLIGHLDISLGEMSAHILPLIHFFVFFERRGESELPLGDLLLQCLQHLGLGQAEARNCVCRWVTGV